MGDDKVDRSRRGRLRRNLKHETRRLLQHASHLSADDIRRLESVVSEFEEMHADDEECARLAQHHSDKPPPWGTKYVNAVEQAIFTVFPKRR